MKNTKVFFGCTQSGERTRLFTVSNTRGMTASVTDYGAALVSLVLPSKAGPLDVVLGYDDAAGYEKNKGQLGAVVGRNANRIRGGRFCLNGKEYQLKTDRHGNNAHSGPDFYNKRIWKTAALSASSITLQLESPHMDQGFPGNLSLLVTYTVTEENMLLLTYEAYCDRDTVFNVTNHSYFNLNGHRGGDVLSHYLRIDADAVTETDAFRIPTGSLCPVENTSYDFRTSRPVEKEYDDNWCLNNSGSFAFCGELSSPSSGIHMEFYTDLPGVQVYTGNGLHGLYGKEQAVYEAHSGICLETQYFVNAVNIPAFRQPLLRSGIPFVTKTGYRFSCE